MKAEQRKELETNILADKVGRAVQRVKTSPRRTLTIYIVVAVIVVLGAVFAYRWQRTSALESSLGWLALDDGTSSAIRSLAEKEGDTPAGLAARLQIAWMGYWDFGIKRLKLDPPGALKEIAAAGKLYGDIREACKGDVVFEPQAMLGVAVCEEAKGLQDRTRLEKAISLYDELAKHERYKDTAEGKFAQGRLDELRDKNGKVRTEALMIYGSLQTVLGVRDIQLQRDPLFGDRQPPDADPFMAPKKKDN